MNHQDAGWGKVRQAPRVMALAAGFLCALASASPALAEDGAPPAAGGTELSPRKYSDKLSGFWLRPPADCEQVKDPASNVLVRWISRDANTRAILWSIGVNAVTDHKADPNLPKFSLRDYALALSDLIHAREGLDPNFVGLKKVDGKDAIDLRGTTAAPPRIWRRQMWVLTEPGRFLVFWASGPLEEQEKLDKLLDAVLGTVKTFNPLEVLKAEEANLLRGRQLLTGLAARKIAPAEAPRWFAFRLDDKVVGWKLQVEGATRIENHDGIEVKTLTMLRLPKDKLRLYKQTMAATAEGAEQWTETLSVGEGDSQSVIEEKGLRQESMIVCSTVAKGGRPQSRSKAVPLDPNEPREMYLPHAFGAILPRLIDLGKPAGYAFATYSSQDNTFRMRTLTVVGPEKIKVDGRQTDAIHLTDVEQANDENASDLWVDAKGFPLRIKAAGWPDIEASTRDEIVTRMPESRKVIEEAMGK